jgi:hypothetical protein
LLVISLEMTELDFNCSFSNSFGIISKYKTKTIFDTDATHRMTNGSSS